MLRMFDLVLFLSLAVGIPAVSQDGVIHITLKDGSSISGYLVRVHERDLAVQQAMEKCGNRSLIDADVEAISDLLTEDATTVPLADIEECEIERSASGWYLAFPGIPVVCAAIAAATTDSNERGMFTDAGSRAFFAAILTAPIGLVTALLICAATAPDIDIDVLDPFGIEVLKEYALMQDASAIQIRK